jgi:pyruvate/2-oxoacid:ferredoxin oxidoreductase beta subunit/Pyruvate/2-oxoacid:ferredoxin oxidoreductase gamma subunit
LVALDKAFQAMGLSGQQICMVSDIGCSGLFDTFFNTHALHGLHGRALTYATGIKLAKPELNVVVTMGDGGLGIGGAHLLSACRRNLDITLLVLNNFNFGMTGGQFSATTPPDAIVGSAFLNQLERPFDPSAVAAVAGAPFVTTRSAYDKDLVQTLEHAITYQGFSFVEIQGACPGRYTRRNKLNPKMIQESLAMRGGPNGEVAANTRPEYGQAYRREAAAQKPIPMPRGLVRRFDPPTMVRTEVMMLGAAGMRIQTAGEILGVAGILAGLHVTQKSSYPITVLRGMSVTDLILSPQKIDYIGIYSPQFVLALAPEGVAYRRAIFETVDPTTTVIQAKGVEIPPTRAKVVSVDLNAKKIKRQDWALGALALMAEKNLILTREMLQAALEQKYKDRILEVSLEVAGRAVN